MLRPDKLTYDDIVSFLRQGDDDRSESVLRGLFRGTKSEALLAAWLATDQHDEAIVESHQPTGSTEIPLIRSQQPNTEAAEYWERAVAGELEVSEVLTLDGYLETLFARSGEAVVRAGAS